ncbi:7a710a38-1ae3-4197-9552-aa65885d56c1 [Thermothielavioides terrestris]|uniref:7a710a38-1ae3-4197-9552-aa65885d56c1 n=1 Tax=Thermothielavioides terrestris TaxID=2587410 RepID=A0A446B716_9PEZI|nr:7a710a38-1ae3-4197-9552-aa65885d56c1 [Thermothielavioides terrestris]
MSERRNSLSPPERRDTADPGARELEASDSEEHYSDARSGPVSPARASPIPRTRVEKVDDRPAYGEVPGTEAYRMREEDAEPDEIAIIPDQSSSSPPEPEPEHPPRPPTPGGRPIPKTVVEETPDGEGAVTHPENRQRRKSDAHPDVVVKADGQRIEEGGAAANAPESTPDDGQAEDDDFGDDFDEFEEGGEDDDFDDFDDGFQEAGHTPAPPQPPPPPQPSAPAAPSLPFPIPTFDDLSPAEIHTLTEPYLAALFPPTPPSPLSSTATAATKENPVFLTPRSASLWSQLVAPPPLQPPDWIRSRIRRLFLVSLGVPVDLDEILPASSKQKKLVLPSLRRRASSSSGSPRRASADARSFSSTAAEGGVGGPDRKSTGLASQLGAGTTTAAEAAAAAGAAEGEEGRERLVVMAAACILTDAALNGMTDGELREHVQRLEAMQDTAQRVLAYWQKRTDEKIGDREAFEGVIENLVKHARKVRK